MAKCQHYNICGSNAADSEELCILHSTNPNKDKKAFAEKFEQYRKYHGDNFAYFVFPEQIDFKEVTFTEEADFRLAIFKKGAYFWRATFTEEADFRGTTFTKRADFTSAMFMRGANFDETIFKKGPAVFDSCHLLGRTFFLGGKKVQRNFIFSNIQVYFNNVNITPPNTVIFRDSDLSRCSFLGTRVDKVEFTNVKWAKVGYSRTRIYDEKILLDNIKRKKKTKKKDRDDLDWEHIERVYRDLKTNHKESGDHERAGDFHYGEKEMRRCNPNTPPMHRFFLFLYCILSGYGERYIRPLVWALIILIGSFIGYMALGIETKDGIIALGIKDWLTVLLYSLQVMTLLRPTELQPIGVASTGIKVFQSISGPIIFGLFALALRQRLKR
jgi:uncharacterized protein YjbI with pentapeptide repeats